MELDFVNELDKIYSQIMASKVISLATCVNNYPTVRLVSYIIYNKNIVFQTGTDLLKYQQICENNNVALCINNIQIEGTANIIGKTTDENNKNIMEMYKDEHRNSYETYSNYEKEILIEININKIIKWDYENKKPYRIIVDIKNKEIKKELYL